MADRVFPNNTEVDMGSKISFSGIDWTSVEQNMQTNKFASSHDEQIKNLLKMAEMTMDDSEGDNDPDDKEDYVSEKTETEELNIDGGKITEMLKESKSNTTMKKIAFTHPSQISAEAIESAKAAGDENLVNTILAARKANRQRIAGIIESKMVKEANLAQRQAQRENIVKMAQIEEFETPKSQLESMSVGDLRQLVASFGGDAPQYFKDALDAKEKTGVDVSGMNAMAFTSPTKFSKAQREAFNKIAQSYGMPSEYVNSMCAPIYSKEVETLTNEVKEIFASNISQKSKDTLITTMIKEAKLSPDSKSEFINYWNNTLGYQDKGFWPDVAADYGDNKKEN
jgi:predicted NAD-dependent protein-ADP-ribosyltransferase YbiA (DUF1768 family)